MHESELILLLIQLAVLLFVGTLSGGIAGRLGLPKVAGELAGGVLLGPTVLGTLWPQGAALLFPANASVLLVRETIIKVGLLFFLLTAGLELNPVHLKTNGRGVLSASAFGIVIPFALGALLVLAFPGIPGAGGSNRMSLALFLGTALSISALPVIAKILLDLGLIRDRFGTLVMSAATVDDLVGWTLFSALLTSFNGGAVSLPLLGTKALILSAVAAAVLFFERPMHAFFLRCRAALDKDVLIPLVLVAALFGAALAQAAGMHAIFGAFLVGALISPGAARWDQLHSTVFRFVSHFFAPLYFVSIGLKVNFLLHFDFPLVAVVFVIACAGKIIGVTAGARLGGLEARESLALGFAMNARGAMEMILAALALEHGMIEEKLFVALVVMALVTSLMSGPAIRHLLIRRPDFAAKAEKTLL